jgi:hypothetical protein
MACEEKIGISGGFMPQKCRFLVEEVADIGLAWMGLVS